MATSYRALCLALVSIALLASFAAAQPNCKQLYLLGHFYDFSELANAAIPFETRDASAVYEFRVCSNFMCGGDYAAACQETQQPATYSLGSFGPYTTASEVWNGVTFTNRASAFGGRTSNITVICNPNAYYPINPTVMYTVRPGYPPLWVFTIEHRTACIGFNPVSAPAWPTPWSSPVSSPPTWNPWSAPQGWMPPPPPPPQSWSPWSVPYSPPVGPSPPWSAPANDPAPVQYGSLVVQAVTFPYYYKGQCSGSGTFTTVNVAPYIGACVNKPDVPVSYVVNHCDLRQLDISVYGPQAGCLNNFMNVTYASSNCLPDVLTGNTGGGIIVLNCQKSL